MFLFPNTLFKKLFVKPFQLKYLALCKWINSPPDQYIEPTNAYKVGSELKFKAKDRTNPTKFVPSVNADPGTNWFDIDTNLIYIVVKGTEPIDIRTTPVVQVVFYSFAKMVTFH